MASTVAVRRHQNARRLIGFTLIVEGLHQHIPKGYIYFAMGFSVFVEMLNLRMRDKLEGKPVHLRAAYVEEKKKSKAKAQK